MQKQTREFSKLNISNRPLNQIHSHILTIKTASRGLLQAKSTCTRLTASVLLKSKKPPPASS